MTSYAQVAGPLLAYIVCLGNGSVNRKKELGENSHVYDILEAGGVEHCDL